MLKLKQIPLTYHWIIRRAIGGDVRKILDLGCGEGNFMADLSRGEQWLVTGVELYPYSIKQARLTGAYKSIIKADVTKLPKQILDQKFDAIFCSQVIEHLTKVQGQKLLKQLEKISTGKIIISTPVGFIEYDRVEEHEEDPNPWEEHRSGWQPEEFEKLGYKVYGQGFRHIYGGDGLIRKAHRLFWPILIIASYLTAGLVYYQPSWATYQIAIKHTGDDAKN